MNSMMHTFQAMKAEEAANKKARGAQAKPTRTELASYYETLRAHAHLGNIQACALLIALAEGKALVVTSPN